MHKTLQVTLSLILAMGLTSGRASEGLSEDGASSAERRPPNIVLIVADDLGYGDLGAYGQEHIQTSHLDRMAQEGLRFTDFYAGSTVCAPSRSVLMTGLHTGHTPIRGNQSVQPFGEEPLPEASVTIAEVLSGAGYRTGVFGKWGLGGPGTEGVPTNQGFDDFYGYLSQHRAHFYWPEFLFQNEERVLLEGNEVEEVSEKAPRAGHPVRRAVYSHDRIAEEALGFIQENQDRRFFAYLPVTIPHASVVAPEEALAPYTDAGGTSIFEETPYPPDRHYSPQPMPKATYAAMVSHLDETVGQIITKLEELGIADSTLVLFTSDNGPHAEGGYDPAYFDSNGPLRGMKRDLYEGGIRVPLIAWWPGTVPPRTTTDHVGYFGDFMATFAELAGAEGPRPNDSASMVPTLVGEPEAQQEHEYLYWEFYEQGSKQAVRKGTWKAVRMPMRTGEIELYNLEEDPGESANAAETHPKIVRQMERIMDEAHTPSQQWQLPE